MTDPNSARRYRFGAFEADASTGELRRQGIRVKLNAQPFQVLSMLLERPGELLTREEISRQLWPEGTFVDFDHGVSSAVNRIREALGDSAGNPRFVETLARRGYRFVAPVERILEEPVERIVEKSAEQIVEEDAPPSSMLPDAVLDQPPAPTATLEPSTGSRSRILASVEDLPTTPSHVVERLLILFQLMYLSFYVGALANLAEIEDLLSVLPRATEVYTLLIVSAAILIPVRAFVLCAVLFHAPGLRGKFLRLWPLLLPLDVLWSLAPFLLLHHINFGLALACTALLVYSPFAQRSLILMGAGREREDSSRS